MALIHVFIKGGPLMYVLLLLSFFAIAIIIEKYRQLFKVIKSNKKLKESLFEVKSEEDILAILRMNEAESPLSALLLKLYQLNKENYAIVKDSIESTANLLIQKLEAKLGWLSTIAAIAPLIGFLGTVTGMVRVFINIQNRSQNGIDISYLAGGIWEALLTTVGGLIVGIFTIICYNDLVQHTESIANQMQEEIDVHILKLNLKK